MARTTDNMRPVMEIKKRGEEQAGFNGAPEKKRFRIAFLTQEDPTDQRTWSGITYHLYHQIGRLHNVTWVHANDLSLSKRRVLSLWKRGARVMGWKFTNHYFLNALFLSRQVQKKIRAGNYDFVVVGAGESELIAYLKTTVPIIYIADSTFANMIDYYPWHTGLCPLAIKQGNDVEKSAIGNAAHLIYSSAWAAASAVKDYGAAPTKISVIDFGANFSRLPSREAAVKEKEGDVCRLLFIGVHWERKGGSLAYKAFLELEARGVNCHLTIIGCNPPLAPHRNLTIIPFLDKNKAEDFEKLYAIMQQSHFLIVPTRADCTPIVFGEAAAFGVPVITTDTGGITSVVQEGQNGYCLPLAATAHDYAAAIERLWKNKPAYEELAKKSRDEFDNRLNWNTWMEKFNHVLRIL